MISPIFYLLLFLTIKSNIFITCSEDFSPLKSFFKAPVINVPNVDGEIYRCSMTRHDNDDPDENKWSIKSTYWSTKLEHIGANNSCSFIIKKTFDKWYGKWIVTTFYKDQSSGLVKLLYLIDKYDVKLNQTVVKLN